MLEMIFASSYNVTVLFMLVIDVLLVWRLTRVRGFGKKHRWIFVLLGGAAVCAAADIACIAFPPDSQKFAYCLVSGLFALSFMFVGFVLFRQLEIFAGVKTFSMRVGRVIAYIPLVVLSALFVVSCCTGLVLGVEDEGFSGTRSYYAASSLLLGCFYPLAALLLAVIRNAKTRTDEMRKYLRRALVYVLPVLAGAVVQAVFRFAPGANMGLTLTVMLVMLYSQDDIIIENAQDNRRYEMMLEGLSRDYNAVYYADLKNDIIEVVKHNRANNGTKYDNRMMTHEAGFDELNDLYCENAIVPADREAYLKFTDREVMMAALDDNGRVMHRYRIVSNPLGQKNIEFQVAKLNETADKYEVVMGYRSIDDLIATERKYQEQLEASLEQARVANMGKTNFLRRMSHDLRTPINGILGMLDIAEHYPDDKEKLADCRAKAREASEYLLSLINDVLDMSKLESGNMQLVDEVCDLRRLFQEQTDVARLAADDHQVAFVDDTDYEGMPHPWVHCSPQHVKHLANNIASNAIKYNREGGRVNVKAEETSFDGETVMLRITVADTGIGMSAEYLEHAFEPFTQEKRDEARTKYASTGLGLSLVKELTDLMGGTISVESEVGVGTTFVVELPLKVAEGPEGADDGGAAGVGAGAAGVAGAAGAAAAVEGAPSVRGMRALLVEDNDINMEIAKFMLENEGVQVDMAWNGEEAVHAFEKAPAGTYDAVFMDVMMPVMDGLTAARAIRELDHPDAATVPIFAMTANAFVDDIARSKEAGMNAHITKPLKAEDIVGALAGCKAN